MTFFVIPFLILYFHLLLSSALQNMKIKEQIFNHLCETFLKRCLKRLSFFDVHPI